MSAIMWPPLAGGQPGWLESLLSSPFGKGLDQIATGAGPRAASADSSGSDAAGSGIAGSDGDGSDGDSDSAGSGGMSLAGATPQAALLLSPAGAPWSFVQNNQGDSLFRSPRAAGSAAERLSDGLARQLNFDGVADPAGPADPADAAGPALLPLDPAYAPIVYQVNKCDLKAKMHALFVRDAESLARTAVAGALSLGFGAALHGFLSGVSGADPQQATRELLAWHARESVPLLVATGLSASASAKSATAEAAHLKKFGGVLAAWTAGGPLLLMDDVCNVLALVRPMGTPVVVPPGYVGLVPDELRGDGWASAMQGFVAVVAVPAWPALSKDSWFRGGLYDARFNWAADSARGTDEAPMKALRTQGPGVYFQHPKHCIMKMFLEHPVTGLGAKLGDFEAQLRAFAGADRKERGGKRDRSGPKADYYMWRRALLVRLALEADTAGVWRGALQGVLPQSMLPQAAPAEPPAWSPPAPFLWTGNAAAAADVAAALARLGFALV